MLELMLNAIPPATKANEFIALKTAATQNTLWVVPAGVTSICVVIVGDGSGGGGGLSYRNDIPVTPGETLTLQFNSTTANVNNGGSTRLIQGGVTMCIAYSGGGSAAGGTILGGLGGKNVSPINHGGGDGGNAFHNGTIKAGGGAGGYAGTGGTAQTGPTASTAPAVGSGGGAGGRSASTTGTFVGGGVGLYGIGNDGVSAPINVPGPGGNGSIADVMCGGGHYTSPPTFSAGIRIIWGDGVSFPNNAK